MMKLRSSVVATLLILVSALAAHAQLYWDTNDTALGAGSGDGTWNSGDATWNTDPTGGNGGAISAWAPGSDAVFSAGGDALFPTITVVGTQSASSLLFEDGSPTLTGGQIDLTGAALVSIPNLSEVATINSVIGGAAGLAATGQGVIHLGGASTYTGPTTLASATEGTTLRLLGNERLPDTTVLTIVRGNGNTRFELNGFDETIKSLATSGTLDQPEVFLGTNKLTLADPQGETTAALFQSTGVVTGAHGRVEKKGAGSITLGGATNGFAGGEFIVTAGNVTVNNNNVFGTNANASKLTMNGGTLTYESGQSMNTEYLDIGGDFGVNINSNGNTQFFGGGNGPIVLKASSEITVNPDPDSEVLPVPNTCSAANPTCNSSGIFILGGIIQNDGATARSITKSGDGTLTITNPDNSYTGDTTIEQGILRLSRQVGAQSTVGSGKAGTGRIYLSGGTLSYSGAINATVDTSRTLTVANNVRVTADSAISYISTTLDLVPSGATTLTDQHNIYFEFTSNQIERTGGTLTFRNDGVCTSNGNSCTFRPTFTGTFNYDGPVVVNNQNDDVLTGRLSSRSTVLQSTNSSGTQTWSSAISGTGGLRRSVAGGTTVLTAANTYAGGTTVDGGTLTASGASATFGTGNVNVTGGTLSIATALANAIADTAMLSISGTGIVNLAGGVNDVIAALSLGGVPQTAGGTYGTTASGAQHPFDQWFTGSGVVTLPSLGQPGDYNEDDIVNAADYVYWRKLNPDPDGPALPNDDSPGVGEDDYTRWVANYGEGTAGGGGANGVPEPGTIGLAIIAMFAAGARHRHRRRG